MDDASLIATRKRRRNAGSRLKQLIELEEQHDQAQLFVPATEDDENVALLFQEDGEDGEFADPEEQLEDSENDSGDDENQEENDSDTPVAAPVNDDEQLSDSDISDLDLDESEGERELQKQEKLKKKRTKAQLIPEIKKRPLVSVVEKRSPLVSLTLESLMLASRRLSLRALVVRNTTELVERLREDEERRRTMVPVVRPKYREMTQEERLKEAEDTERRNVIALHLFRQQEVVKKEQRRINMFALRAPMVDVVRFVLKETFISPNNEVEEWRKLYKLLDKYKRRPTRKRQVQEHIDLFTVLPGVLQKDLPFFEHWDGDQDEVERQREDEGEDEEEELEERELTPEPAPVMEPTPAKEPTSVEPLVNPQGEPPELHPEVEDQPQPMDVDASEDPEIKQEVINGNGTIKHEDSIKEELSELPGPKRVTFAEEEELKLEYDLPFEEEEEEEEIDYYEPLETGEVFAGPVQRVAVQRVYVLNFEDPRYTETLVKSYVLGPQAILPASHRFKDLKTIFKSGGRDDYGAAAVKKKRQAEQEALFTLVSEWSEDDSMFDRLRKLPRLGIRQEVVDELDDENDLNSTTINITTEAPLGLYLPNNNKKTCMILGKEVRYFDPHLGVPYTSVEDLELIKTIERGMIPWYSFASGTNDTGPIEVYLGHRDTPRHARGVPPGFA